MAEIFIVETLSHYIDNYPNDGFDIEIPPDSPEGRFPSLKEIHSAFVALNLKIRPIDDNDKFLCYDIEDSGGSTTEIVLTKPLDMSIQFGFTGGELRLIVEMTERLARSCGPFVLIPASGAPSLIVIGGSDPNDLVDKYVAHSDREDDDFDDDDEVFHDGG